MNPLKKMMHQTKFFDPDHRSLNSILDFITDSLEMIGLDSGTINNARFKSEDLAVMLIEHASGKSRLKVSVRNSLKATTVTLSCAGTGLDYREELVDLFSDELDEETESMVHDKILSLYEQDVILSRRSGVNIITITAHRRKKQLLVSAAALLLGALAGLIVKAICPESTALYVAENIFGTGTRLFFNAVKMLIPFLVFFSIASGISGFGDMRELGRVFGRVNGMFAATSIMTILVAYGIYTLIPIGHTALRVIEDTSAHVETINLAAGSLPELLVSIVPGNILLAFSEMNMLQLLFLAILFGFAVSGMKEKGRRINEVLTSINEVFEQVTRIIVRFTPICVFCAIASMVLKLNPSSIASVTGWVGLIYLCDAVILCLLLLLLPLLSHTSPIWFVRQYGQVMLSSFALSSSSATMPLNMQVCRDKLDISPKVYAFSIPLGIVVNMDGSCVTLLISALFLSKVYGIPVTSELLVPLFVNVFMLSVAAPGVTGGTLLCLTALLPQIGIPVSGITIVVGLYFLVSMMQTMINVTSTAVCSFIVDRWEKAEG
ncbi:MAG: dicarboxylate/amino acid:cation symporter [Clostridia bacterium]|nr:dicarboxylate/amino acid:cation symporter [Clostridia bacterium]